MSRSKRKKRVRGSVFASGHQAVTQSILKDTNVRVISKGKEFKNTSDFPLLYWVKSFADYCGDNQPKRITKSACRQIWNNVKDKMTDKSVIYIAATPAWLDQEYMNRLDGGILHEAFHSLYTTRGRTVDFDRLVEIMDSCYDPEIDYKARFDVLRRIHNIFEDAYIERKGLKEFRGAKLKIQSVHELIWEREKYARNYRPMGAPMVDENGEPLKDDDGEPLATKSGRPFMSMSPLGHFTCYLRDRIEHYLDRQPYEEYDERVRMVVDTLLEDIIERSDETESSYDTFELAMEVLLVLQNIFQESEGYTSESQQNPDDMSQTSQSGDGDEGEGEPSSSSSSSSDNSDEEGEGEESNQKSDSEEGDGDSSESESEEEQEGDDSEDGNEGSEDSDSDSSSSGGDSEDGDSEDSESGEGSDDDGDEEAEGGSDSEDGDEDGDEEQNSSGEDGEEEEDEGDGYDPNDLNPDRDKGKEKEKSESGNPDDSEDGELKDRPDNLDDVDDDLLDSLQDEDSDISGMEDNNSALKQEWEDQVTDDAPLSVIPFTREHDDIIYLQPEGSDREIEMYNQIAAEVRRDTMYIRPRMLNFFRGQRKTRLKHRQEEGRRLSSRSVSEVVYKKKPRPFQIKEVNETKEACVSLIIDESQSMGHCRNVARKILTTLALTIGQLRIPMEIIGFTTNGVDTMREHTKSLGYGERQDFIKEASDVFTRFIGCQYRVFREFDEPFNIKSYKKLVQTEATGLTPLPDGIEFAAKRIAKRREDQKIIFVVTDGYPCYGGHSKYTSEDYLNICKNQIEDLKYSDVEVLFIGVGGGAEFVEKYPNSVLIKDMDSFARHMTQFLFEQMQRLLVE